MGSCRSTQTIVTALAIDSVFPWERLGGEDIRHFGCQGRRSHLNNPLVEEVMRTKRTATTLILATALFTAPAISQESETQTADTGDCAAELDSFAARMNQDGLWVRGWGNRYNQLGTPVEPAATTEERTMAPWAGIGTNVASPRAQIRELYSAAQVLSYRGEEEGCTYLLAILDQTYGEYATQLSDAGVEPDNVLGWRQEQIALAEPIESVEVQGPINVDDLTGTDVRTPEDESLGSVSDLILEPGDGEVQYAVVARGGILGIGTDYVAVPWDQFRATDGLNTLVIDTTPERFEDAPTIEAGAFSDARMIDRQHRGIESYWNSSAQES